MVLSSFSCDHGWRWEKHAQQQQFILNKYVQRSVPVVIFSQFYSVSCSWPRSACTTSYIAKMDKVCCEHQIIWELYLEPYVRHGFWDVFWMWQEHHGTFTSVQLPCLDNVGRSHNGVLSLPVSPPWIQHGIEATPRGPKLNSTVHCSSRAPSELQSTEKDPGWAPPRSQILFHGWCMFNVSWVPKKIPGRHVLEKV